MTYKQAINYLLSSGFSDEQVKGVIKALNHEPCEDAISRNELLKAIDTWDKFGCDANTKLVSYQDHYIPYIHYDDVVKCIKGMPPVTPQPNIGHLIFKKTMFDKYGCTAECSDCHKKWKTYDTIRFEKENNYCPNCGVKLGDAIYQGF